MLKLRLSPLLTTCALLICHMHSTHAAPVRTSLESMSDQVMLTDYEAQRLLSAVVKEFMQMTSEEREQKATEGNSPDRPMSKRCTNLSTCVLAKLSQDIHKLQTYPRTNVGAGTPGKKRSLPEHYANYGDSFDLI